MKKLGSRFGLAGSRENRRKVRVHLKTPLKVVMGSIGSEVRYDLMTRDLSNNGFFLDFEKPGRFPFTPASIMEVWLNLGGEKPIFFNGKMARVVYPNEEAAKVSGPGIAIRIVQIDPDQEKILVDYINRKLDESEAKEIDENAGDQQEAS